MRKKIAFVLALCMAAPSLAVTTSRWTQTGESEFKDGTFHNVVATNLGDLKLSRAVKLILEQDERISAVHALAEAPDGTIYAGTGPRGVLLQIKDGVVSTAATLADEVNILSVLVDPQGRVLIGTGGEHGRVLRIDKPGEEPKQIFAADGVQYIWALKQSDDGSLYAATGPNGQLFELTTDGKGEVILDSNENNILSLAIDKGMIYAGTDPNGLVYRIDRKTKEFFVLYDAAETEVSALALDRTGNLYAGTAQAGDASGRPSAEIPSQIGRPEEAPAGVPIPSQPPPEPKPPEMPDPSPGEPDPIPKTVQPKSMVILQEGPEEGGEPKPPTPGTPMNNSGDEEGESAQVVGDVVNAGEPAPNGNAIYRIDPQGFVNEIFRQPVLVLSIVENDGSLLVGTGSEGQIYQINPSSEEILVVAKVDPKQVLSLCRTRKGDLVLGLANTGGLATMTSGFAREGTYTSAVLDAQQISRFGKIQLHGSLPKQTTLTLSTRSGNVREDGAGGWSKWSDEVSASEFMQAAAPPARFFQYRLTFKSAAGEQSPIVEEISVAYQVPNLPPKVTALKFEPETPAEEEGENKTTPKATSVQKISWEGNDPNSDTISYSVFFRRGSSGPWILLKDKIKETNYKWDTKSVADGRYTLRVLASDAGSNPRGTGLEAGRVSDPLLVDNTPAVIGDLKSQVNGKDVQIDLRVADRTSTVALIEYAVDSNDDWQPVLPSDNIFDGPDETTRFNVTGLSPGPHQIALRATDVKGNQAHETIAVTIETR
jgi:hypothetical protein